MTLENKYNVPTETIKRMVKDGVISCSVSRHYEIYDLYKSKWATGQFETINAVCYEIERVSGEDFENVKKIIYKLGKI